MLISIKWHNSVGILFRSVPFRSLETPIPYKSELTGISHFLLQNNGTKFSQFRRNSEVRKFHCQPYRLSNLRTHKRLWVMFGLEILRWIFQLSCVDQAQWLVFFKGLWEKTSGQPRVIIPEVLEHYWSGGTAWQWHPGTWGIDQKWIFWLRQWGEDLRSTSGLELAIGQAVRPGQ